MPGSRVRVPPLLSTGQSLTGGWLDFLLGTVPALYPSRAIFGVECSGCSAALERAARDYLRVVALCPFVRALLLRRPNATRSWCRRAAADVRTRKRAPRALPRSPACGGAFRARPGPPRASRDGCSTGTTPCRARPPTPRPSGRAPGTRSRESLGTRAPPYCSPTAG